MSAAYFGIITNENGMSNIYRYLLDFKKSSYSIVGKLRNNKDEMVMIKFLLTFDTLVDFFEITNGRFKDVFNTIIPVEEQHVSFYIDLIKRMTYIQTGYHPVTKMIEDDERYYSSEDSLYTESDEDNEDDEPEDDDDDSDERPITALAKSRNYSCVFFVMSILICGLIYIAHDDSIQESIYKAHSDFRSSVGV
jgi:hypothetical protein